MIKKPNAPNTSPKIPIYDKVAIQPYFAIKITLRLLRPPPKYGADDIKEIAVEKFF